MGIDGIYIAERLIEVKSIKRVDLSALDIPVIAVYRKPLDYPDKYVARVFDGMYPTDIIVIKDTFLEIQKDIAEHTRMTFVRRWREDVASLVGTWI